MSELRLKVLVAGVETLVPVSQLTEKSPGVYVKNYKSDMTVDTTAEDASDLLFATDAWKIDRQTAVDSIEVTYNGVVYQGDETSQDRMSRAINALPDTTTTVPWVAKDNSVKNLTKTDLQAILLDAGTQQSQIWNTGRPT
ncbi:DUF4376 domain-containing protein [Sulfurimonas sp. HSL-1716]|uniref:DUF4376 domain-containing protein n=1 Tax=Hydrocurvibacter sulfurireducens TaxID=3131937 RepID=UPI0031F8D422